ncbi:peptidoglycan-binding protein [Cylindrospermum sp. FACHB-282]|uniref:peptidoglycan-binding protein n=1 Tax=Cylindrospermum sp. FACHB-282 TaxID=2692794 RepID=UPI001689FBB0|nr:peptidoglycan-binding protein [Cylindrospermum sp. FACHB-282]MBD2386546.1 peptidoglycan-binding protein [Cylindrospermum sp. FACHB-282]
MKFTRREIIFSVATAFTYLGYKYGIGTVQAQSIPAFSNSQEALIISDLLASNTTNREQIYQQFLNAAAGGVEDKPVLLYQGINTSPYKEQIQHYPTRLKQKPNGKNLVDGIKADSSFRPFPVVGQLPEINQNSLKFLHEDIKEACICVGSFSAGSFQTKWLGRNALNTEEFWSGTKIISLLYTAYLLNKNVPGADITNYNIKGLDQDKIQRSFPFSDLAKDMITYEEIIATSNALGAVFKRFSPQIKLEKWLKNLTGNDELVFRGRYSGITFIDAPRLVERRTEKIILTPDLAPPSWACNAISAYDLTRIISMLGWHNYLPQNSQLPSISQKSLDTLIKIMGTDTARLTDLAIKTLGLQNALDSVVIISKLGNGVTVTRQRTEAVYLALVQFIDRRPQASGKPAKFFTLSMALRGVRALKPRNLDQEVVELDARMATEVAEIIKRAISGILA